MQAHGSAMSGSSSSASLFAFLLARKGSPQLALLCAAGRIGRRIWVVDLGVIGETDARGKGGGKGKRERWSKVEKKTNAI
jgi:hypothetical protein